MRKLGIALVMALVLSVFSVGAAQSSGFGLYSGWPVWIGGQLQTGNLRLGAGLGYYGIGGGADLILAEAPLVPDLGLTWYYGAGVSAYLYSSFRAGIGIFPHGLLGLEWAIPGLPFTFYGEGQIGFTIGFGGGYTGLDYEGRSGIIFR